jgi:hypothetical protein
MREGQPQSQLRLLKSTQNGKAAGGTAGVIGWRFAG